MNNEQRYKKRFGIGDENSKKACMALKNALDIRKFEIELYWKRATYFWALIAVSFAGYFAVLGSDHLKDKEYLAYLISCVGLVFTWAWFLVNKGSKFWQENWENHVDMLEDNVTGPLYKTILHRPRGDGLIEKLITGPAKFSASKINQWVSLFAICIWLSLIIYAMPEFSLSGSISWRHVTIAGITLFFIVMICKYGRTHMGPHHHKMRSRKTRIL